MWWRWRKEGKNKRVRGQVGMKGANGRKKMETVGVDVVEWNAEGQMEDVRILERERVCGLVEVSLDTLRKYRSYFLMPNGLLLVVAYET